MKKAIKIFVIGALCALCMSVPGFAADAAYEVEVINNADKKDTVTVVGVEPKSTVSVYSGSLLLGKKTAGSTAEVTITVKLPDSGAGTLTVSVLEKGASEPKSVAVPYDAEPVTPSLSVSTITISNNVDTKSTVTITDLEPKDTVTIYNEKGKKLVSGKVGGNKDEITLNIAKGKLDKNGGKLYITVKSVNMLVCGNVEVSYAKQPQSAAPTESNVEITNNVGKKGTIVISNLESGDTITVYNAANDKKLVSKKCGNNTDEVSLSATLVKTGGTLKITLKRVGELVSEPLLIDYLSQPATPTPTADNVVISTYPTGTKDTLYLTGLQGSDAVKVYTSLTGTSTLLKGTVGSSADSITLSTASFTDTYLYISVTRKNMLESDRLKIAVPAVQTSEEIVPGNVTISNYAGTASTIYVTGLAENATITVYNKEKGGSTLGSAKVASGGSAATISISQLSAGGGSVWLTRKDKDCTESEAVEINYGSQSQTVFYDSIDVEITNNSGTASTIKVTGLESGDIIRAYETLTTSTTLATVTCGTYADSVTLSTSSLNKNGGTVYLTLTESGCLESKRTSFSYSAVGTTSPLSESQVTVTNNTGIASTVAVTGLSSGDVITAYNTEGTTLGSGTVASYASSVTFNVSSLTSAGGSLQLTGRSTGKSESSKITVSYSSVSQSVEIPVGDVTILNYSDATDTVTVRGLDTGDVIKVYKDSTTTAAGTATASSSGSVTLNITLNTSAGSVWVTRTSSGKTESARTNVTYLSESTALDASKISVVNNVGIDSTVTVTGLDTSDVVKVYSSSSATTPIGSGNGASGANGEITIKVGQLSSGGGTVYVTVTNLGKCESSRTAKAYQGQITSEKPAIGNVVNTNGTVNITIMGLLKGDYITVYSDSSCSTTLGGVTANQDGDLTLSISLGASAGTVYITRTSTGKRESVEVAVGYTSAS